MRPKLVFDKLILYLIYFNFFLTALLFIFKLSVPALGALLFALLAAVFGNLRRDGTINLISFPSRSYSLYLILGTGITILPLFGSGTLLFLAILLLVFDFKLNDLKTTPAILKILLLLVLLSSILQFITSFDAELIKYIFLDHGLGGAGSAFGSFLRLAMPAEYAGIIQAGRFSMMLLVFIKINSDRQKQEALFRGLIFGSFIAFPLCFLQTFEYFSQLFPNQNNYWTSLGRSVGTFSDANAFGVAVFFIFIFCFWYGIQSDKLKRKAFYISFAFLWIALATFSGSRTLFAGIFLVVITILWSRRKRYLFYFLIFLCAGISIINIDKVYQILSAYDLPVSLDRLLSSLNFEKLNQTFFSRIVFLKLNTAIIADHPLFGIGWNNFRELVVPYAEELKLGTGLWNDNSNNFYLGFVAEQGMFGLLLLMLLASQFCFKAREERNLAILHQGFIVFLMLLLLGPHIAFDEIAILFALLAAMVLVRSDKILLSRLYLPLSVLAVIIAFVSSAKAPYGFYNWEANSEGYFRWSRAKAMDNLTCKNDKELSILIRDARPGKDKELFMVELESSLGEKKQFTLKHNQTKEIKLRCIQGEKLYYKLNLDKLWSPGRTRPGSDPRVLGVQIYTP